MKRKNYLNKVKIQKNKTFYFIFLKFGQYNKLNKKLTIDSRRPKIHVFIFIFSAQKVKKKKSHTKKFSDLNKNFQNLKAGKCVYVWGSFTLIQTYLKKRTHFLNQTNLLMVFNKKQNLKNKKIYKLKKKSAKKPKITKR